MKKIYSLILLAPALAAPAAQLQPADFENLGLASESCWTGDAAKPENSFKSGSFTFSNIFNPEWGSWANYGYANYTSNVYPGGYSAEAQTINAAGGGHNSSTYGVAYCDFFNPAPLITLDEPAIVPGVYITNTAWTADAILNGDGISPAFGAGDYLKLILTGIATDESEKKVEFYLADYRQENSDEHYYVNDWRWLDLSVLGEVKSIKASMETTKSNEWGPTTPLYFALDDLGAAKDSGVSEIAGVKDLRVSVIGGIAYVECGADRFEVTAATLDGIAVTAGGINGKAEIALPAPGVNILHILTPAGKTSLKVYGSF